MNFGQGEIEVEVHGKAVRLVDFQGRQTHYLSASGDVANVIVRRRFVPGASNDLGFVLKADGSYAAVISEYDSRNACKSAWVDALSHDYAQKKVAKEMKKKGFALLTKKAANGKQQLQYVRVR